MTKRRFFSGACPACPGHSPGELACPEFIEGVEGLRMTMAAIRRVVGQPLVGVFGFDFQTKDTSPF